MSGAEKEPVDRLVEQLLVVRCDTDFDAVDEEQRPACRLGPSLVTGPIRSRCIRRHT